MTVIQLKMMDVLIVKLIKDISALISRYKHHIVINVKQIAKIVVILNRKSFVNYVMMDIIYQIILASNAISIVYNVCLYPIVLNVLSLTRNQTLRVIVLNAKKVNNYKMEYVNLFVGTVN